ncbi:unnamed protein product [Adineta steineri]|nr:unnamed protein product [Adineta steineri]
MNELKEFNEYVVFHIDEKKCVEHITSIVTEKVLLIISGQCLISDILQQVESLRQLDSVYIFCSTPEKYEHLPVNHKKIIGIFRERCNLIHSLKENIKLVEKQLETFSFYNQHEKATRDLSKESAEFLWFQIFKDIILKMRPDNRARQDIVHFSKNYYRDNEKQLEFIDDFERNYNSKDCIKWYTKSCFLFKLINKALRTEDIDQLHTFRLFIADLSLNLATEHQKLKERYKDKETILLYRGTQLQNEELQRLQENVGNLISTNGYLSTSYSRTVALMFAGNSTNTKNAVVFEIECPLISFTDSLIFADIRDYSIFQEEEEVLFDLGATFKILSIDEEKPLKLWIIKMKATEEGANVARDYIELNRKDLYEEFSPHLMFGRLLTDMGKYDQSLKYFKNLLNETDPQNVARIYNSIGEAYRLKGDLDNAMENYTRSYTLMMEATPPREKASLRPLRNMGIVFDEKGQYDKALEFYFRALDIAERHCGKEHLDTASILINIGCIWEDAKQEYTRALEFYDQGLKIYQKQLPNDHIHIATCLNNIGVVHGKMTALDNALDYHKKALEMFQKLLPPEHDLIALSLGNIANTLRDQNQLDNALAYYMRALKIQEKIFGSNAVQEYAEALHGTGNIYESQQSYTTALEYYGKALEMYQKLVSDDHPDILKLNKDITRTKQKSEIEYASTSIS